MKRISKMLSLLLVFAMIVPGIAQAANLESAEGINRIKGENRWGTAVAVSEKVAKGDTVILANGQNYPDALAGSALAKALNAPILLTKANELPVETAKQLKKLAPKTVILLGGETVIGEEVVEALKGYKIERIDGSNRAETAAKVAEKVVAKSGSKTAVLAYGNGFADALSVGPVAGAKGWPILFTSKAGQLTNTTKDALVKLGIKEVVIVGGTSVISDEVKNELANDYSVRRIAGANRYETSLEIAKEFGNVEAIMLANAQKYADALVGAPLAAALNAPIILVKDKSEALNEDQAKLVKESFEKEFYILGGEAVVSKEVEAQTIKLVEEAAEEAKELKVVSVSAINANYVTVAITAPAEDMLAQEVEVKNGAGVVVPVKPLDIAAGDETAEFEFVTAVKAADLKGVWTVNGQSYDLDVFNNLSAFLNAGDQLALNKALTDLGIKNVDTAKMPAYFTEKGKITKTVEELTVEDVQKLVDAVNTESLTKKEEKAIVKTVVDALKAPVNEVELLQALQNPAFVRVNPEWMTVATNGYVTTLGAANTSAEFTQISEIQAVINTSNDAQILAEAGPVVTGIDKAKLNKAQALVDDYGTVDKDGKLTDLTVKTYPALIKMQLAVADVVEATTPTAFKNKLTALATLVNDTSTLDAKTYKDANGKTYIADIKALNAATPSAEIIAKYSSLNITGAVDTVAEIEVVLTKVNADAAASLVDAVKAAADVDSVTEGVQEPTTAEQKAALVKALKDLGVKQVADENIDVYSSNASAVVYASVADLAEAQTQVDKDNVTALNGATKDTVIAKLNVFGVKNVVAANAEAYVTGATKLTGIAADITGDNKETVKSVQDALDASNKLITEAAQLKVINEAETVAEVKTALDVLADVGDIANYLKIRSVDRDFVAAYVLDKRASEPSEKYADVATQLTAQVDAAQGAYSTALTNVNAIKVDTAIDVIVAALDGTLDEGFKALSPTAKVTAAEAFHAKLTFKADGTLEKPFITISAVKALLK